MVILIYVLSLLNKQNYQVANIVKFQLGWRDKPGEINCIDNKIIKQLISCS